MNDFLSADTELAPLTIVLRLAVAAALGGVIGFDREHRGRAAGLRTHMLIALAAAAFAIITHEVIAMQNGEESVRADPLRVIEAVTSGVAFLAAGAIIQARGRIRGLTTGAGMWLAGALGVAAGTGLWSVAIPAAVIGIVVIVVLRWFEDAVFEDDETARKD